MKLKGKHSGVLGVITVVIGAVMVLQAVADVPADRPYRSEGGRSERERGRASSWDKLPEAKRERMREVLRQVFESDEVKAARDRMIKASEGYKDALREAIGQVDSELQGDIEKILRARLESDFGGRGGRFRGMMIPLERVPAGQREKFRELMMKFGELPEVKALRKRSFGGGGKERSSDSVKMRVRELALFRAFVTEEAPGLEKFVPEKPPMGAPPGREGERDRRREGGKVKDPRLPDPVPE